MEDNDEVELQQDMETIEPVDETPFREDNPAALTLVIQSWATPIVGIVMLVIGLFGGYFIRSILTSNSNPVVAVDGSSSSESGSEPITIPTPDAERAAQQQELMTALLERTRHFRGDPDAPVTIIEFSDFQ